MISICYSLPAPTCKGDWKDGMLAEHIASCNKTRVLLIRKKEVRPWIPGKELTASAATYPFYFLAPIRAFLFLHRTHHLFPKETPSPHLGDAPCSRARERNGASVSGLSVGV